jgi:hypothetical protein
MIEDMLEDAYTFSIEFKGKEDSDVSQSPACMPGRFLSFIAEKVMTS